MSDNSPLANSPKFTLDVAAHARRFAHQLTRSIARRSLPRACFYVGCVLAIEQIALLRVPVLASTEPYLNLVRMAFCLLASACVALAYWHCPLVSPRMGPLLVWIGRALLWTAWLASILLATDERLGVSEALIHLCAPLLGTLLITYGLLVPALLGGAARLEAEAFRRAWLAETGYDVAQDD